MKYCNLRDLSDFTVLSEPAWTKEEALALFAKKLGVALTFVGVGEPPYLFGERDEPLGWVKTTVPVYIG
jgi:hypothetical protein